MKKLFKKIFIEHPKKNLNSIKKRVIKIKFIVETRINNKKRQKKCLTDLKTLSFDIPELITDEKLIPNDFYFIAYHLKKFIGRESKKIIKASIEHGLMFPHTFWDLIINDKFPGIITLGECRRPILEKLCPDKKIYTIGPFINYVDYFFTPDEFQKEKKKLGRNLLVFPAHSTHHMGYEFDEDKFCQKIIEMSKDFDSVSVCLYWKDILRGCAKKYQKYGFNCVCAGHIYDPLFLPRVKSIISLSDYTMSNEQGTHVGYCLYLNKPHYLFKNEFNIISFGEFAKDIVKEENESLESKKCREEFYNYFSEYNNTITKEQWEFANQYFGFDKIKTKDELKVIFDELDEIYKKVYAKEESLNRL